MSVLITDRPTDAYKLLYKALERLIINRLEDGAFTDDDEVRDREYFSILEGLECLLIPFVNLPKNQFWEPIKTKYPQVRDIIIDDINIILDYNRGSSTPPSVQGNPYFTMRKGRDPYWTSECASFTLSVLTNFLELRRKFSLPSKPKKKTIEDVMKKNFEWVQICKRDQRGWAWTSETLEHPWPTWSLLDTFEEILWYRSTSNLFAGFNKECEAIVKNIISRFNDSTSNSYLTEWKEKVASNTSYSVESALNLGSSDKCVPGMVNGEYP